MQNVRLIRATKILERRMFLKALALGLTVPVAARLARTATAAPSTAPKRFFLMYMPHGIAPEHYNPKVSDSDRTSFALDQTNVSILSPLEPYKSYVNVYQGFEYPGGNTHDGIVNCLSGYAGGTDTTGARTSVEHVIAHGLNTKPLILGACSHLSTNFDHNGMLFWDGTAVEPQKSPVVAADSLFGGTTTPTQPVNADVELRGDLLTLTASEISSLQSTLTGLTTEQTKLQRHLDAINGLKSGVGTGSSASTCTGKPSLPTVDMIRAASAGQVVDPSGSNDYFYQEANFRMLLQAQLELTAQAIVCNAAQVIALMPMYATCDFDFSFSQLPGSAAPNGGWAHHAGLSHTGPQAAQGYNAANQTPSIANLNPDTRAAFAGAQLWFAQQLVKNLVSVLATTDDPSAPGTKVLDNTLIYWMSEIGDGQLHTTTDGNGAYPPAPTYLPLVSIGKAGGAIKSGQIVHFDTDRPAVDLYTSFAQAMGVTGASFPGATGPVTEVLA